MNETKRTRAPDGASSIYEDKHGKWHGRVTMGVRDDGRPDRRHVRGKNRAEVTRKVRKLEEDRNNGRARKPGRAWTVEQWLRHWVDNVAAHSVRYKTLVGYRTDVARHLIPGLGAHRINRLEPEHIERLYGRMLKAGLAAGTVHHAHRTLRASLNEAVRRKHVTTNAAATAKPPKIEEEEIEPLTVEEARHLLSCAARRRNGARWAVALSLGLRQGEALGMRWPLVDLEAGTMRVRKSLQRRTWQHGCEDPQSCGHDYYKRKPCPPRCKRHARECPPPCAPDCRSHARWCPRRREGGLVLDDVKSRAARRTIALPADVQLLLIEHQEAQDRERDAAGQLWEEHGFLFAGPTGRPIDPRADNREWSELLEEAGVREARLHDARHTAATVLLVLGVPQRAVMGLMGWSNTTMTTRYQHLTPDLRRDIADRVGGLLWVDTSAEESR